MNLIRGNSQRSKPILDAKCAMKCIYKIIGYEVIAIDRLIAEKNNKYQK